MLYEYHHISIHIAQEKAPELRVKLGPFALRCCAAHTHTHPGDALERGSLPPRTVVCLRAPALCVEQGGVRSGRDSFRALLKSVGFFLCCRRWASGCVLFLVLSQLLVEPNSIFSPLCLQFRLLVEGGGCFAGRKRGIQEVRTRGQ